MPKASVVLALIFVCVTCAACFAVQAVWLFSLVGDGRYLLSDIPIVSNSVDAMQRKTYLNAAEDLEAAVKSNWGGDAPNHTRMVKAWEVTMDEFYDSLLEFTSLPDKDDILLFYYAGHGNNGNLGPVFEDVRDTNYDSLAVTLASTNAQSTVVVLDTCNAGSAIGSYGFMPQNTWILGASCADWPSWSDHWVNNISPFTAGLVEAIRGGTKGIRETWGKAQTSGNWDTLNLLQLCPPVMKYPSGYASQDLIIGSRYAIDDSIFGSLYPIGDLPLAILNPSFEMMGLPCWWSDYMDAEVSWISLDHTGKRVAGITDGVYACCIRADTWHNKTPRSLSQYRVDLTDVEAIWFDWTATDEHVHGGATVNMYFAGERIWSSRIWEGSEDYDYQIHYNERVDVSDLSGSGRLVLEVSTTSDWAEVVFDNFRTEHGI